MPFTTVQTEQPATLFAGALGDSRFNHIGSRVSEEASAEIPFGVMVAEGSSDLERGALLVADQADKLAGVFIHSHAYHKSVELGTTGLKPDMQLGVLEKGLCWVSVSEAVTPASPVRVTEAGGGFLTTAAAGVTIDCSAFCRFRGTTTGAGLVLLEVDMTNRDQATLDS